MIGRIGSQALPEPTRFRARVEALVRETQIQLDDPHCDLVRAHNAYVLYSALLLMHGTGHRPVVDPFCYRQALGDGIAVVEDKATTERQSLRLLILPQTVVGQLRYYDAHLAAIADRLADQPATRSLADAIDAMLSGPQSVPSLPLFFFLSADWHTTSVSPTTINSRLTDWPWPLNLGRHLIASGLHRRVPAAILSLQLGHARPDEAAFTAGSPWSPAAVRETLAPALEKLLRSYGWRPIHGLAPRSRRRWRRKLAAAQGSYNHGTLGPELRRLARRAERAGDRLIVRKVLRELLPPGKALDQSSLDQAVTRLASWSEGRPRRYAYRKRLLWRWAKRVRGQATIRLSALTFALEAAEPPFWRGFPKDVLTANALRRRFVDYLAAASHHATSPSPVQRLAEVAFSAALFGGLVDAERLAEFYKHAPTMVQAFGDQIVVQGRPDREAGRPWRWIADDLSAALVISCTKTKPPPSKGVLRRTLAGLIQSLDPSLDTRDPIKTLSGLARAYWLNELPGFVAAHVTGEIKWQPLSTPSLVRLLHKQRLQIQPPPPEELPPEVVPTVKAGGRSTSEAGKEFYKSMQKVFAELENIRAHGSSRSKRRLLAQLSMRLTELLRNNPSAPAAARVVAAWAVHLAVRGTKQMRKRKGEKLPAFRTVRRYVTALGPKLIEWASDQDLLNLSDLEFEVLYNDLCSDPKHPLENEYLAERLSEFHAFLATTWGVEVPEWGFLVNRLGNDPNIDADIVTPDEYRRALRLLLTDPAADERARVFQAALTILGYRFGLRSGEAIRLLDRNLTLDRASSNATVEVASNIYGSLKSPAGARVVPLIGSLYEAEWDVLERLKSGFAARLRAEDPHAGLFANPTDPRAPIERGPFVRRIRLALRLISGNPQLHFHLLRHSFACRLIVVILGDLATSPSWTMLRNTLGEGALDPPRVRRFLFGTDALDDDCLRGIAKLLGHADVQMTLGSYVHLQDFLIQALANRARAQLPNTAWSYALGEKTSTIAKRLERHPKKTPPVRPSWPDPIPHEMVRVARGRPQGRLPADATAMRPLTLDIVDRILLVASERHGQSDRLAEQLFLSARSVTQVIDAAEDLTLQTKYYGWSTRLIHDRWPSPTTGEPRSRLHAETTRTRKVLQDWQERLDRLSPEEHSKLAGGLKDWATALRDGNPSEYVFETPSQLKRFVEGCVLLGIDPHTLTVRFGHGIDSSNENVIAKLKAYHFAAVNASARLRHDGVRLRVKLHARPLIYTSTLTRALFVTKTLLAVRQITSSGGVLHRGGIPRGSSAARGSHTTA